MIIKSISLRSRLILITTLIMLLFGFVVMICMDSSSQTASKEELLLFRSALNTETLALQQIFVSLNLEEEKNLMTDFHRQLRVVETALQRVSSHEIIRKYPELVSISGGAAELLNRFKESIRFTEASTPDTWIQAWSDMELLGEVMGELEQSIAGISSERNKSRNIQLAISLVLGLLLVLAVLVLFTVNLNKTFKTLLRFLGQLSQGILPPPMEINSSDELGQLASQLDLHVGDLQKKIGIIHSMSHEGSSEIYAADEMDQLGTALVDLSEFQTRRELDEVTRNREDKKQNWISEGTAQLGEVLHSERENVSDLSFLIIQKLVKYMNLEMGSLFISLEEEDQAVLDLIATYAYDRRKYNSMKLEWGEGLPGSCAQEGKTIFLTDVPGDYFHVASGIGHAKPNCILLVPLKMDKSVRGVIELATVRLLRPFEIEFVEAMSKNIASTLMAVRNSERNAALLKQSLAQAQTLQEQDGAMRENMQKLEQAQNDSMKKESEINGILTAIKQSTLVAELGLNGRFTSINDQFILLLESQQDQVVGKLYSDFAMVDRSSDGYKAFWTKLKEGQSISNTEMYKLYSGAEVWLKQTFTPITNNQGRVQKILNIAEDITEKRALQDKLETQDHEIARKGLDLQTLNEAVNASLVKCELDAEGIIMDINDRFIEVSGYSRKELLGRNYRLFLKDTEKEQFEKIWNEVSKEKLYEGVIRRSKPTGEEVWLVSTFSPVKDETGLIYKVYYMGLDITEKKLKYQLLEDANLEIERLKSRLTDYEN
jgi:PAS domain S-box-containing protein